MYKLLIQKSSPVHDQRYCTHCMRAPWKISAKFTTLVPNSDIYASTTPRLLTSQEEEDARILDLNTGSTPFAPAAQELGRDIHDLYSPLLQQIRQRLQKQLINLTLDASPSPTQVAFWGITSHYIELDTWQFRSVLSGCKDLILQMDWLELYCLFFSDFKYLLIFEHLQLITLLLIQRCLDYYKIHFLDFPSQMVKYDSWLTLLT